MHIVHTIFALFRFPRTLTALGLHFSHTFFVLWLHFDGIFPVLFLHWIERWLTEVFREIAIWLTARENMDWTGSKLLAEWTWMETKWSVDWIWDTLLIDFLIPFIVHFVSFEHHFFSSIKKKMQTNARACRWVRFESVTKFCNEYVQGEQKVCWEIPLRISVCKPHSIIILTWTLSDLSSDINVINGLCCYDPFVIIIIIIIIVVIFNTYTLRYHKIIIIFNIYIAQINIQEDIIKYALHVKIEYEIIMLPIYNCEFTIKCEDVYYMKH